MSPRGLTQGLISFPGINYETKALAERLLAEDRDKHHCFYGKVGFHNHLPHHLLAVYDFGVSAKVLQAIYDAESPIQSPINLIDRKEQKVGNAGVVITEENWTEHLGPEKHYSAYLAFFMDVISKRDPADVLEEYIFSPRANGNGALMLLRTPGLAVHPLIQIGYGVEFNDPTLVAAGLAEICVTRPIDERTYADTEYTIPQSVSGIAQTQIQTQTNGLDAPLIRRASHGPSLLEIIKQMYDSPVLKPVMPYDPDALVSKRSADAMKDGRPEEIRRLASKWTIDASRGEAEFAARVEEIIWLATLLTVSTGKHGRKPRLDFFLMHTLTASLFLPTLVRALKNPASKVRLLRVFVPVLMYFMLLRGRPRIDPTLIMTYAEYPRPPTASASAPEPHPAPDASSLGDPREPNTTNPWPAIIESVIHSPDAHTVKAIRTLYYAAQRYGTTPRGGMIGAFDAHGNETLVGAGDLDGTIFVRAAGVVMDTLGWVAKGQNEGSWDRSGLGWDAAWDGDGKSTENF